jgi:serine/threonine protein kinase
VLRSRPSYAGWTSQIDRLLALHDEGIVHRDLNADNFLLGHHEDHSRDTLFLVDFGLAAPYMHPETGEHIPESIKTYFTGTVRFASCNQLKLLGTV